MREHIHDDLRDAVTAPLLTRSLLFLTALAVAAAAAYAGLHVGSGDKLKIVLPLVLPVAAALGVLAMTRFSVFVLLILGARASLDLFKLSGPSAGNTATNTAARGWDPSSMLAVLFLLAAFLWLGAQYQRKGRLSPSIARYAFIAFVAACFCSALGSPQMGASFLEFTRILAVLMMFIVLEELATTREMVEKILVTVFASSVYPLAYTLYTMAIGDPASEDKGSFTRISGPFSQSTTFGRYLAFLIIFGVAIYPHVRKLWQRRSLAGILSLSTVFLLLTLTRGALFAAVLGVFIVGLAQARYRMLACIAGAGVISLFLVPGLLMRLAELGATQAVGGGETGNTLAWRLRYWTDVLPLANSNPVTGIGLTITQYRTPEAKQPHNDFLRAYVEIGLFGLVTYVLWLASFVKVGLDALRRSVRDSLDRGIAAGFLGCAVAFTGQSFGANVMSNVVSLWYLVAFAAVASAVAYRSLDSPDPVPGVDLTVRTPGTDHRAASVSAPERESR